MAASPRDLLKPRPQRLMEVAQGVEQQTGFADSQYVTFGCVLAPGATTSQLAISAGEYCLGQQLVEFAAAGAVPLTGSALPTLSAGQACNVLVEADAGQNVYLTPGAVVAVNPATPSPNPGRIVLGHLALTGAFTPGTTALTAAMCVTESYDAGNVNPSANGF